MTSNITKPFSRTLQV